MSINRKRVTAGLASLLLISSVTTACSSTGSNASSSKSPAATSSSDKVSFPLSEKVNFKMVTQRGAAVKKDYNELSVFKRVEQDTNVHVDWQYLTADNVTEKMNLIFATNEMPDAFYGPSTLTVIKDDQIMKAVVPLNDLIDKYAPNVKKMFEDHPEVKAYLTQSDGNIYTLPIIDDNPINQVTDAIFINKKWLDELGMKVPTTTDEFEQALLAFKKRDPKSIPWSFVARNGIMGIYSMAAAFGKGLPPFANQYINIENGNLVFAPTEKENLDYYKWLNKLYREGVIDPEVFTHNGTTYNAKVKQGNVGVFSMWALENAFGAGDPKMNDYVQLMPLKGPNGATGWNIKAPNIDYKSFAITKTNKNPQVAMAWADRFYAPQLSMESNAGTLGTVIVKEGDKYKFVTPPQGMTKADFRYDNSPGYFGLYYISRNLNSQIVPDPADKPKNDIVAKLLPFTPKEYFTQPSIKEKADQDRIQKWQTDVMNANAYYDQAFAKMVLSSDPEKEWNDMVKALNGYGLNEVLGIYKKYMK